MSDFDRRANVLSRRLSRRGFIKVAAAVSFLAGCRAARLQSKPTSTSLPTSTPRPIDTPHPTDTPRPQPTSTAPPTVTSSPAPTATRRRPDVIQMYPEAVSKVVHTRHAGVWSGESLEPNALRQMLDASITELTGLNDAGEAWRALFQPGERVAIKVNAFRNSLIWTHAPLVMAITDALQDAGVGADQIVIFDCLTSELETAGYPVNEEGAGVRCYGNDSDHVGDWNIVGRSTRISRILMDCDALINVPVLKAHRLAGLSFAMKNHYGTISNPSSYHRGQAITQGMAEINALPPIRDRTRLIVGDMLAACLYYGASYPYWEADWKGDALLMSFDPVAHDTVGLDIIANLREAEGGSRQPLVNNATPWLRNGAKMGLGTNAPDDIDLVEVNL